MSSVASARSRSDADPPRLTSGDSAHDYFESRICRGVWYVVGLGSRRWIATGLPVRAHERIDLKAACERVLASGGLASYSKASGLIRRFIASEHAPRQFVFL